MQTRFYGLTSYGVGLELQQQAHKHAAQFLQSTLIGLEHEAVITLGKRGAAEDLQFNDSKIKLVQTDRGGQATLHSPGQLVIYPVLPLQKFGLGVADFVELLHVTTEELLKDYAIETHRTATPGIYTEFGKIGFFGIRIEKSISRHGLAINVHNDLGLFNHIRSCGVENASLDSMSKHGRTPRLEALFNEWSQIFKRQLGLTRPPNFEITESILLP